MTTDEIANTFNAGHAEFRAISSWLWEPLGAALSEHTRPVAGERVLDACCGAGASAIPAAREVGPSGRVDAVDVAEALLAHGRAEALGLGRLRFHRADVTAWHAPGGEPYDLVQCGYGVFFLPDMDAGAAHLVSQLRAGGRFAVLTWAEGALVAVTGALFEAAGEVHPEPLAPSLARAAGERLNSERKLSEWLSTLGLGDVRTTRVQHTLPLTEEMAWNFAMGSGLRRVLDTVGAAGRARVRDGFLGRLRDRAITELNAASLVGVGHRTPQGAHH
ncbi:MAG: methyltransferase domain-containing protein [Actinomycetota bacterium]|nr:methyltransferase domain-containing protein [Actinomycetota bacterium]